jgi:hypothetical protein
LALFCRFLRYQTNTAPRVNRKHATTGTAIHHNEETSFGSDAIGTVLVSFERSLDVGSLDVGGVVDVESGVGAGVGVGAAGVEIGVAAGAGVAAGVGSGVGGGQFDRIAHSHRAHGVEKQLPLMLHPNDACDGSAGAGPVKSLL